MILIQTPSKKGIRFSSPNPESIRWKSGVNTENPELIPKFSLITTGLKGREFPYQILSRLREFAQTEKTFASTASLKMTSIQRKIKNQKIAELARSSHTVVTVHFSLSLLSSLIVPASTYLLYLSTRGS